MVMNNYTWQKKTFQEMSVYSVPIVHPFRKNRAGLPKNQSRSSVF